MHFSGSFWFRKFLQRIEDTYISKLISTLLSGILNLEISDKKMFVPIQNEATKYFRINFLKENFI